MPTHDDLPVGVLLAGGRARRMGGGDKCLAPLGGRPLLAHAITRLGPQVGTLVISVNGDPARFAAFGLPVVADSVPGFAGPLAGILSGMYWARRNRPAASCIVTAATDTPFFPPDLVARLREAAGPGGIAIARTNGRLHGVFGVFPVACADRLASYLNTAGTRRVGDWLDDMGFASVDFPTNGSTAPDPFFNINTPEDLASAEAMTDAPALRGRQG